MTDNTTISKVESYYRALGKFADTFASAEDSIQVLLWRTAGLEGEIAKAVFSGMRVRAAIDCMKRIEEVTKPIFSEQLKAAFAQLNTINTARDSILHYGTRPTESDSLVNSTKMRVISKSAKEFPVSAESVDCMTADLETIQAAIFLHLSAWDPDAHKTTQGLALAEHARAPWRYKPPQPPSHQTHKA